MAKLRDSFFAQFAHPRGALGWLVGHLMAWKNGERSRWAIDLLSPRPGEKVLEVGFGPGVDLQRLLRRVGDRGFVAGVDISNEMVRQARARNRAAVAAQRARIELGSPESLPFGDGMFDAIYSSNSAQFWPDLPRAIEELQRVLSPSGRLFVVVQPMWPGATKADTDRWEEKLVGAMRAASFADVKAVQKAMPPAPATCAIALREVDRDAQDGRLAGSAGR
ncbi:MAG: methyltransferase domain-containing protein [Polyangiaceae bacterium]|nr:methyltransferase domain-containing protein [Polyangiaceae bacterium]